MCQLRALTGHAAYISQERRTVHGVFGRAASKRKRSDV